MSILTGYFPLDRFGLEYDYELSRKLRERQRQEEERAMEVFKNKLVYGKSKCLLEDVRIELIERGMNADNLNHVRNTMADVLSLHPSWQMHFLPLGSKEFTAYRKEMSYCVDFALCNRQLMMDRIQEIIADAIPEV